ncbi:MAG: glutamate--tRNA ligase, partial [Phycisphaerales bacterium]|nr:glutamate--tRNA ligase [Phycisphaerales bacterium]
MTKPIEIVRTRFAPSPSGHLHVGGARTALFCWAYARKRGGKFMLRIEDTDQKRSSDAAGMAFLEDLKWLGIHWDEGPEYESFGGGQFGPYFQSQRLDIYNRFFDQLIAEEKAYRAFETPQELDAAREKARLEKRQYRYDRAALNLSNDAIKKYLAAGLPYVVRFKTPDDIQSVAVHDEVRGDVVVNRSELDDFVIRKADGFPMYNFAVVVDDELMGVTHVIRAQEHLNNTIRHVLLQDALGFRRPIYAHVSLITNPDGSKMSKRDKDKALRAAVKKASLTKSPSDAHGVPIIAPDRWTWWLADSDHQLDLDDAERLADALQIDLPEINVDDFRRHGYLPEVMINYLALLGWSPGNDIEKFDRQFIIDRFDFDRVVKTPAKFDREKLLAFNLDAIQAMPSDEFVHRFREHCRQFHPQFIDQLSPLQFEMLARANHERSKTLEDPIKSCRFFLLADDEIQYDNSEPVQDALLKGDPNGYAHLEALLPRLRDLSEWTIKSIETAVKQYAEEHAGGKLGKVAQPLRIAVSGGVVSPAIFDTLAILG